MESALQSLIVSIVALTAGFLTIVTARQWRGAGPYLCSDCRFDNEKDCHKTERGKATDCLSYTACTGPPPLEP